MKRLLALSVMAILLLLSITSLTQISSTQIADAQTVPDFNFIAVGDWGCTSNTKKTVTNIVDKNPELVLGLGDYSYKPTADCWLKMVDPIDDKMKIAIGNHDYRGPGEIYQYMDHFGLTEQYYSFNYQNIHFVALSTEVPFNVTSAQYQFVNNDLSRAASNPNTEWIVVYFHKQMYTLPSDNHALPTLRSTYHPLFEQYGVDLVLQAHNHNYERTYPIKFNSNSPFNPITTTTNTNTYTDPDGQIFATIGTGGVSLYTFTGKADHFVKQYGDFGILNIDVTNEPQSSSLTGKFYANNGKLIDQFIIYK
jgi:predicted MPP superfamily phosphohydrolase